MYSIPVLLFEFLSWIIVIGAVSYFMGPEAYTIWEYALKEKQNKIINTKSNGHSWKGFLQARGLRLKTH